FIMLYNFTAAILRSRGDTRRPMAALISAGMINLILNLVFVVCLHMTVEGVALATVISNGIGSLWLVRCLTREEGEFQLSWNRLSIDCGILKEISIVGIPAGLQAVIFSVSNVMVQSAVNHLGDVYIAANTTAASYDYVAFFIFNAFNNAALTFVSQNYAAGNLARARKCAWWALGLAAIFGLMASMVFIHTRWSTVGMFTADPEVQRIACIRIAILLSFGFFNGSIEVCSGILRGFDKPLIPAFTAMAGICGLRIALVVFMPQTAFPYEYLMSTFPITWVITFAVLAAACSRVFAQIREKEKLQTEFVPAFA
ncbi:MAG: polysaccharide biosynthesis C-terminal domain-containing protein, partial [Erysipelotrichaceae bacterium]|nr:polysaccharide biosynthesis C-terminal domain-containing protein [Erysipelotrichaceae bacterium]